MAVWTASYGYARIRVTATEDTVSIPNNTSRVVVKTEVYYDGGKSAINGLPQTLTVKIDGASYTPTTTFTYGRLYPGNSVTVATQTRTVTHNSDGAKSVAIWVNMTDKSGDNATVSQTLSLTKIPRVSDYSLSATTVALGSVLTFTISRASSSFVHSLHYRYGSEAWVKFADNVATSYAWTLPADLANKRTTSSSGALTVAVDTHLSGTRLGAVHKPITFTIPDNATFNPTASIGAITERATHGGLQSMTVFVQNKSALNVAKSGSAKYGATITEYMITYDGVNYYGSGTTQVETTKIAGTRTLNLRVKDSRGRYAYASTTVSIQAYSPPTITTFSAYRSPNDQSTNLSALVNFSISSLANQNAKSYSVKYGTTSATTVMVSGNVYSMNETHVKNGILGTDNSYVVTLEISDSFGGTSITRNISSIFQLLNFNTSGRGMAIGQVSTKNAFQVNMDIETTGGINSGGPIIEGNERMVGSSSLTSGGINLNNIVKSGMYRLGDGLINGTADAHYGQLLVMRGGDTIAQLLLPYNSDRIYRRSGNPSEVGGSGSWRPWVEVMTHAHAKDYVVDSGPNFTKWNSGKLEQWGWMGTNAVYQSAWGGFHYYTFTLGNYPIEFKTAPYRVFSAHGTGQLWMHIDYAPTTTKSPGGVRSLHISTVRTDWLNFHYYAVGKWK